MERTVWEVGATTTLDLTLLDLLLDGDMAIGRKWTRGRIPNAATQDTAICTENGSSIQI
jgi:hypothetical protein